MRLKIKGLGYSYDHKPVLKGINLVVKEGEVLGLIGPNGSGKTTLLKNISSVIKPDRGAVYLDMKKISRLSTKEISTTVAAVEQETQIGFDFTVQEVVRMGRFPYLGRFGHPKEKDEAAIQHALQITDLQALSTRYVNRLSGGEKQRVFLALALAQEPKLLLLDEPTANLDISYQLKIMKTINNLSDRGLTVISAIHDLDLAANFSDRIAILSEGRLVDIGFPEDVLDEKNISEVFEVRVNVDKDPIHGSIHIHPWEEKQQKRPQ